MNKQQSDGAAITSLILGIVGLIIFPLVLGILALLFASGSKTETGVRTAGIVLGIICVIWAIIQWLVIGSILY